MVLLSISVESFMGLTWPLWRHFAAQIERLGFTGIYCSDHFVVPAPPNRNSLEAMVALTYLADHSRRVSFGTMVSPLSFRDPVMLARHAVALDDLSGGRMILGVGAGWNEREHRMFGYHLGDIATRMDRLEEGLEVITRLLRSHDPVNYVGRFYRLQGAVLRPRPNQASSPRVLVGGSGPQRTLPLVSRFADVWNAQRLTAEGFRERSARLDALLESAGRRQCDVRRTLTVPVVCGRSQSELEWQVHWVRANPAMADVSLDRIVDYLSTRFGLIIGSPASVLEQISAYAAAGLEELVIQYFAVNDFDILHLLAEEILAHLPT